MMNKPERGMIIQSRGGEITNSQTPLAEAMRDIHPIPRLLLGLLASAAISIYAPLLLLTLTGQMVNSLLGAWIPNLISIVVLALITLAANKFGRVMLVSTILAIALDLYIISLGLRTTTYRSLYLNWPQYLNVTTFCLLNGYLFTKYKKAVGL